MIKFNSNKPDEMVCNFEYLSELMGGKRDLILKIMDTFLVQVQEELRSINEAILVKDFASIKMVAHTMKSSVSIMGITKLMPVLQEMQTLGAQEAPIEQLEVLNDELHSICKKALIEIEKEKQNYT